MINGSTHKVISSLLTPIRPIYPTGFFQNANSKELAVFFHKLFLIILDM